MPNLGPDKPDAVHVIVPVKDGENNINLCSQKKRKKKLGDRRLVPGKNIMEEQRKIRVE